MTKPRISSFRDLEVEAVSSSLMKFKKLRVDSDSTLGGGKSAGSGVEVVAVISGMPVLPHSVFPTDTKK